MTHPLVTFIAATYNRGAVLIDCLRKTIATANTDLGPGCYEIIIVDNASPDGTANLVARSLGDAVHLIPLQENQGPVAKNHGIVAAQGQYVVFLDDDAYPEPGALSAMLHHFQNDPALAAAVFDVRLPDGTREGSAYPDVFIGAGTAFRHSVLQQVGGLPPEFFMQAEEYDLSFRILRAGHDIRRFADMPLVHLKTPGARIAERTTRLDVRNNLYLLAKYVPAPLCWELAADWLSRYWCMALARDRQGIPSANAYPRQAGGYFCAHRKAFLLGAGEGLHRWPTQRRRGRGGLADPIIERIFKFALLRDRMARAAADLGFRRIVFADWGKNMLAYWRAGQAAGLDVVAIADDNLAAPNHHYRGIPLLPWSAIRPGTFDAIVVSNMSPVQGPRRAAALRATQPAPVIDLMEDR